MPTSEASSSAVLIGHIPLQARPNIESLQKVAVPRKILRSISRASSTRLCNVPTAEPLYSTQHTQRIWRCRKNSKRCCATSSGCCRNRHGAERHKTVKTQPNKSYGHSEVLHFSALRNTTASGCDRLINSFLNCDGNAMLPSYCPASDKKNTGAMYGNSSCFPGARSRARLVQFWLQESVHRDGAVRNGAQALGETQGSLLSTSKDVA